MQLPSGALERAGMAAGGRGGGQRRGFARGGVSLLRLAPAAALLLHPQHRQAGALLWHRCRSLGGPLRAVPGPAQDHQDDKQDGAHECGGPVPDRSLPGGGAPWWDSNLVQEPRGGDRRGSRGHALRRSAGQPRGGRRQGGGRQGGREGRGGGGAGKSRGRGERSLEAAADLDSGDAGRDPEDQRLLRAADFGDAVHAPERRHHRRQAGQVALHHGQRRGERAGAGPTHPKTFPRGLCKRGGACGVVLLQGLQHDAVPGPGPQPGARVLLPNARGLRGPVRPPGRAAAGAPDHRHGLPRGRTHTGGPGGLGGPPGIHRLKGRSGGLGHVNSHFSPSQGVSVGHPFLP
mmetsp:Transcript_32421/g.69947  ORF Transcript_32421/g.69947 Transcript_32421/m.69947 type:complete len:347 (-) Transcript_32421:69-1109(-)